VRRAAQPPRQHQVVVVEDREQLSLRDLDRRVARARGAARLVEAHETEALVARTKDEASRRFGIRRGVVHDDDLEVTEVLRERRGEASSSSRARPHVAVMIENRGILLLHRQSLGGRRRL